MNDLRETVDPTSLLAETRQMQGYSEGDLRSIVRQLAQVLSRTHADLVAAKAEIAALNEGLENWEHDS